MDIHIICPICGSTMGWGGDFCASDFEIGDDELVRNFQCQNCGASADVYETFDDEKSNYPYYQEHPELIRHED